ncbi:CCDC15 [Mytilus coruscus]|uniref:CCDC15 n=1 Tax=Mytilus coruscus TaxID=42192 RepID=A0A6J8EF90_MYTCO|nr:CCDC15 [Mytilus coruscus]
MASKKSKETFTVKNVNNGLRKICKPVISTDVMGNRNVEVRAVGAWVQPASAYSSEAVHAAHEEQERIQKMQEEKNARLKRFREDVKHRVSMLEKAKRQQQQDNTIKAVQHEHKVVRQSAFGDMAHRKDSCLVRKDNTSLGMRPKSAPDGRRLQDDGTDYRAFCDQTNEVHKLTNQARRQLAKKQIVTDDFVADDLPGGVWKVSSTRDHPASRSTADPEVFDIEDSESLDLQDEEKENIETSRLKVVHFDKEPSKGETREERISRKSATTCKGTQVMRNIPRVKQVPNIYNGLQSEEEKRRQKSDHATYRRLFMDLEREQVKENIRRQEHRKRILKLKKDKEEERKMQETAAKELVEPRDPLTGESALELLVREIEEHKYVRQKVQENEQRIRKQREMERFVEALKHQLKERIGIRGKLLPAMCCCGETLWDTNPDTYANNCVFYKNHKAYAKALQSLLASCEID